MKETSDVKWLDIEPSNLQCCVCGRACSSNKKMRKHYKKKHAEYELLQCSFCDFVSTGQSVMRHHKKREHPHDILTCCHCSFSTRRWNKWIKHQGSMHPDAAAETVETGKDSSGHNPPGLKDNLSDPLAYFREASDSQKADKSLPDTGHKTDKEILIKVEKNCGQMKGKENSNLETHDAPCSDFKVRRPGNMLGRIRCKECDKSYAHKSSLKLHMRVHSEKKAFVCSMCSYSCRYKHHLEAHEHGHHHHVSQHRCELCDKSFRRKSGLTYHMQLHNGEQPLACQYCEYTTTRDSNLRQHLLSHMGIKPYKCNHCDYETAYRSNLAYHVLTHSTERPFSCPSCGRGFRRKDHLQYHVRAKHLDTL